MFVFEFLIKCVPQEICRSCWRTGIALLLNFLPLEEEKNSNPMRSLSFGAIWCWFFIRQMKYLCHSHLKEMFIVTKCFVWPLWISTDLPTSSFGFLRQLQPYPVPGIFSSCLHSPTLAFNLHYLLSPLSSVPWLFGCPCYFQEPILFLAVILASCTVF